MQFTKSKKFIAVIDCNNFFVSCERVFRPELDGKPVIVMSSNDGCAVARSKEVKDLGIPMGAPMFQIKDLVKKHKIEVFSCNFALYENFSDRVFSVLLREFDEVIKYSIDESFVILREQDFNLEYLNKISAKIFRETGIPVTVGAGHSKTQAKIASKIGKKKGELAHIFSESEILNLSVGEVWGIGRQTLKHLSDFGVQNLEEFLKLDTIFIQKNFGVTMMRTYLELKGVSCIDFDYGEECKKSIRSTRSFGKEVRELTELQSSIAYHISNACERLRSQRSLASSMRVFINSDRFKSEKYFLSDLITFENPTDDEIYINKKGQEILQKIFISGVLYKKAGIILYDFEKDGSLPSVNLFNQGIETHSILMDTLDSINNKWGEGTIRISTWKQEKNWHSKAEKLSPNYVSDWNEIPVASFTPQK